MLREIFTFLGFQFDEAGFVRAKTGTEALKRTAQDTATGFDGLAKGIKAMAAIAAGSAIVAFTNHIADEAFEVGKLSEQLGLSTHDLQAWELGAKRVGVTTGDLSIAFRRLALDLAGGHGEGTKTAIELFKRLGIDTKASGGAVAEAGANAAGGIGAMSGAVKMAHRESKTLGEILPQIAEKIKNLTNENEKVAIAQQLFGKSGERLLPILNQGAAGVAQLAVEFDKLGGGFSPEAIKRAQEFKYETFRLEAAWTSFKSTIAVSVLPYLTKTVDKLVEGTVAFKKFADTTTLVTHGAEALAAVLAFQLASALAPYLGTGLKFAAIFLAVDDLLAFLEGKDSVIGDLLNRAFGDGTATQVREWVNDAQDSFGGWLAAFKVVIPDISAAFGLEFAKVGSSWDSMILGFEKTWNEFVGNVTGFSGLQFSPETLAKRQGMLMQDAADVGAAQNRKDRTAQGVANFASASTALSGQGAAAATGPLRAPQITQNFVEVKPNISITVPPGTSRDHAARLVREAAAGVTSTERRAAGQTLAQKGGK
jgi:hypothetical protein